MRTSSLLGGLLLASVGLNAWLVLQPRSARIEPERSGDTTPASSRAPALAASPDGSSSATPVPDRGLHDEVAALRTRLEAFEGMDPVDSVLFAGKSLSWKLKELARLPDAPRAEALRRLAVELARRPEGRRAVFETLESEPDPATLLLLSELLRFDALPSVSDPAESERLLRVLRHGSPPERRVAAATASKNLHDTWGPIPAVIDAESDPAVLASLAKSVRGDRVGPVEEPLRRAAARLPAGAVRREVLHTLGRGVFWQDERALIHLFRVEADPARRDDIAAALARTWLSVSSWRDDPETNAARRPDFFHVYRQTGDVAVRKSLLRATLVGTLELGDPFDALASVAATEPDSDLRRTLEDVVARHRRGDSIDWRFVDAWR